LKSDGEVEIPFETFRFRDEGAGNTIPAFVGSDMNRTKISDRLALDFEGDFGIN